MRVMGVFQRYDYGIKARGDSLDYVGVYPALKQLVTELHVFWYDEYLNQKERLQSEVKEFAGRTNPDIIIFGLMKDEFSFTTFDYLRNKYITVNWFADDKYRFDDFTKYYAPHFSYSITTDKYSLDKYDRIGYKNTLLSQWAAFAIAENMDFENIQYAYDVSFVGMVSSYRKWLVRQLEKAGIAVSCFGWGWEKGRVSFDKVKEIFKTSRINLNISNSISYDVRYVFGGIKNFRNFMRSPKRFEDIKARNFEIPALGGFELTKYVIGLENHFTIGSEIAVYVSPEELVQQLRYYLSHESERKKIAKAGYARAVSDGTYVERFRKILDAIRKKSNLI